MKQLLLALQIFIVAGKESQMLGTKIWKLNLKTKLKIIKKCEIKIDRKILQNVYLALYEC